MATSPLYPATPQSDLGQTISAANTAMDGTGTVVTVFTADATNGGECKEVIVRPLGTNVATVLRIFENNGATNATATNNSFIEERTLPATTASANSELIGQRIVLSRPLPPGYKINVTLGTAVAAGFAVSGHGHKY